MMSTAITTGGCTEQANVLLANSDYSDGEVPSFAHRFDEQIELGNKDIEKLDKSLLTISGQNNGNSNKSRTNLSDFHDIYKTRTVVMQSFNELSTMKVPDSTIVIPKSTILPANTLTGTLFLTANGQPQEDDKQASNSGTGSVAAISTMQLSSPEISSEMTSGESSISSNCIGDVDTLIDESNQKMESSSKTNTPVSEKTEQYGQLKKPTKIGQQRVETQPGSHLNQSTKGLQLTEINPGNSVDLPTVILGAINSNQTCIERNLSLDESTVSSPPTSQTGKLKPVIEAIASSGAKNRKANVQVNENKSEADLHNVQTGFNAELQKEVSAPLEQSDQVETQRPSGFPMTVFLTHTAIENNLGVIGGSLPAPSVASTSKAHIGEAVTQLSSPYKEAGSQDLAGSSTSEPVIAHEILSATPTTLEVGLQTGSQGWLKIRAEITSGGSVNASLSPTTLVGQEMLHKELPALTAYLQQEKVAVSNLTVHSTTPRLSTGDDSGRDQAQSNGSRGEGEEKRNVVPPSQNTQSTIKYSSLAETDENSFSPNGEYMIGGNWLNIRV